MRVAGPPKPKLSATGAENFGQLDRIARKSLEANIHNLDGKAYVSAGRRQFNSLWTRDFAWSTRGLLALGRSDVVKDQLDLLLNNLRAQDHVLPRTLDSMDPNLRVVLSTVHRVLPVVPGRYGIGGDLKPQFKDQRGQVAFDGNILAILATCQYAAATGDRAFFAAHKAKLKDALAFYAPYFKNGLLQQPEFSDWQDSVKRQGATFYSNMLYVTVSSLLADDPYFGIDKGALASMRAKIDETFKDPATGLYRQTQGGPQLGLDANLLALDLGYIPKASPEAKALFDALRKSPLWTGANGPGFTTYPAYPSSEKSTMDKFVGLGGYHDTLYWSWLMALSAKVAFQMGEPAEANAILGRLEKSAVKSGNVGEVYAPKKGLPPKKSILYESEHPFTWGSAFVVDAVSTVRGASVPPPALP